LNAIPYSENIQKMTPAPHWLWLSVRSQLLAPLLFWKFFVTPAGVHSYTPDPVHHCCLFVVNSFRRSAKN